MCGELIYEEKNYYFYFSNNILVIQPNKMLPTMNWFFNSIANQEMELDGRVNISGENNEGKEITFIGIKFARLGRGCLYAYVPAYIIGTTNNITPLPTCDNFNKIEFSGGCIDNFYYPKSIVEENEPFKEKKLQISVNFDKQAKKEIKLNGDLYSFYSTWNMPISKDINIVLNVESKLTIKFNTLKSIDEVIKYYIKVSKFFEFLNNRNHVTFKKIRIYKDILLSDPTGNEKKTSAIFELNITQSKQDFDIKPMLKSIRFSDIEKNYKSLYLHITKQDFITEYYPDNENDDSYVDNRKYVQIDSSFESEFNKFFPEFKSETSEAYKNVKEDIEKYLKNKKETMTGKKKKYYKYFLRIINNIDGSLMEKVKYTFDKFDDIICTTKERLLKRYRIETATNEQLAEAFANRRNKISHGDEITNFTDKEVIAYCLLKICVYCLTFENTGFSKEEIKNLTDKLF